jgi:hypothetical protein
MSIHKLTLLLAAVSLSALVQPTSLANAAGESTIFRLLIGSSGGLRDTVRVTGMMVTRSASRSESSQLVARAALRRESSQFVARSATARAALRRETPAAKNGAEEIEDETVGAFNRGNKLANELSSPMPVEALASPPYSFAVLNGKLKVDMGTRVGNLEIKGGEIDLYKSVAVVGAATTACIEIGCLEALKNVALEMLGSGGSPKSFEE